MDEDLAIIAKNTRREEIKNFFIKHKKKNLFFNKFSIINYFLDFFLFRYC